MIKQNLKQNKGISMVDVIIAMIILSLFVGVIGNLYYQIALQNDILRMNAVAVYYTVKVAEGIDKMSYEEVTAELNNTLKQQYEIPDMITISIDVENYNETDSSKEDVIKTVKIEAKYTCLKEEQTYTIKKLKIKE